MVDVAGVQAVGSGRAVPGNPGDFPTNPFEITTSGSLTIDITKMTFSLEPALSAGTANQTAWLRYSPAVPLTLNFVSGNGTTTYDTVVEVFDESLTLQGFTRSTTGATRTIEASQGVPVLIRVSPFAPSQTWTALPVSWTAAARTSGFALQFNGGLTTKTVPTTPVQVLIDVADGTPSGLVTFARSGTGSTGLGSVRLDGAGQAIGASLQIGELNAGTYTITGTDGPKTATITLTVTTSAIAVPAPQAADPAFTATPTVNKWTFFDPTPGGETYVFEIGPSEMTSPHAERVFAVETTTARDGQTLTWEGGARSVAWVLKGRLVSKAQLDALRRFHLLNRRVWIIDHFARAWIVTVEDFEAQPQRRLSHPYLHEWNLRLFIYAGPVTL